jgi:hypothetical protein
MAEVRPLAVHEEAQVLGPFLLQDAQEDAQHDEDGVGGLPVGALEVRVGVEAP